MGLKQRRTQFMTNIAFRLRSHHRLMTKTRAEVERGLHLLSLPLSLSPLALSLSLPFSLYLLIYILLTFEFVGAQVRNTSFPTAIHNSRRPDSCIFYDLGIYFILVPFRKGSFVLFLNDQEKTFFFKNQSLYNKNYSLRV